jgi:hypothetical protein
LTIEERRELGCVFTLTSEELARSRVLRRCVDTARKVPAERAPQAAPLQWRQRRFGANTANREGFRAWRYLRRNCRLAPSGCTRIEVAERWAEAALSE